MDKKMKTHHNHMDIASKSLEMQLVGVEPLGFLGIHTASVQQLLSNELPAIRTEDDKADIVFLLEDNSILHIEFQSTTKKSDAYRFGRYHLELYDRHKEFIINDEGVGQIKTVVIYMPHIKRKQVRSCLKTEQLHFEFETVFLNEHSADSHYEEITDKIMNDDNVVLTPEEQLYLIYNPLMLKENKDSVTDRTLKVVNAITKHSDETLKFKIIGAITVLTKKYITEEDRKSIWEVFKMNRVFQREIDELYNEKQKELEIGKIKKAITAGDLEEADVLFKYSSLTPEEYEKIKNELSQK